VKRTLLGKKLYVVIKEIPLGDVDAFTNDPVNELQDSGGDGGLSRGG
jgi:hypothetical protein